MERLPRVVVSYRRAPGEDDDVSISVSNRPSTAAARLRKTVDRVLTVTFLSFFFFFVFLIFLSYTLPSLPVHAIRIACSARPSYRYIIRQRRVSSYMYICMSIVVVVVVVVVVIIITIRYFVILYIMLYLYIHTHIIYIYITIPTADFHRDGRDRVNY